jgi:hypothetical protein
MPPTSEWPASTPAPTQRGGAPTRPR